MGTRIEHLMYCTGHLAVNDAEHTAAAVSAAWAIDARRLARGPAFIAPRSTYFARVSVNTPV